MKFLKSQLNDALEIINVASMQLERNQMGLVSDNILNALRKLEEAKMRAYRIMKPAHEPAIEIPQTFAAPEEKVHGESAKFSSCICFENDPHPLLADPKCPLHGLQRLPETNEHKDTQKFDTQKIYNEILKEIRGE